MTKYKLVINGRKVETFLSLADVEVWFKDKGIEVLKFFEEDFGLEEGVLEIFHFEDMDGVDCWNEELCERGDDYCQIRIEEV